MQSEKNRNRDFFFFVASVAGESALSKSSSTLKTLAVSNAFLAL